MNIPIERLLISTLIAGILTSPLMGRSQNASTVTDPGLVSTNEIDGFSGVDPNLVTTLVDLDKQSAAIAHFRAAFTQDKKTPLLRKPLRSTGVLLAQGPLMRWNTDKPHASVMLIDQRPGQNEITFYYADDELLEIHPLNHKLGQLAGFPLPRFQDLASQFVISNDDEPLTDERGSGLGLKLTPKDEVTAEHLQAIRLLVDTKSGLVWSVEISEEDGATTLLTFSDFDTKTPVTIEELELEVPAGTEVLRTSPPNTTEAINE